MGVINKFLLDYVNKINSLSARKTKTNFSIISRKIQNEVQQSLSAIAFRDYIIRDLFELSVKQSPSHFVMLDRNSWNQFQNQVKLNFYPINSVHFPKKETFLPNLNVHKNIYKNTTAKAILITHPIVIYELVLKNIDYQNFSCIPNFKIFNEFIVLPDDDLDVQDNPKQLMFSYNKGLISWGPSLFEVINRIESLIFCAKLAILNTVETD